jgi:flavodoxin
VDVGPGGTAGESVKRSENGNFSITPGCYEERRDKMNTLIMYDSTFGTTEHLARVVADRLAEYGTVRLLRVPASGEFDIQDTDVLVVGGPTQRHGTSQSMRAFLEGLPRRTLSGLRAAAFDTRYYMSAWKSGSAARGIASRLKRAGASLVVPPESFFVAEREGPLEKGERERAEQWAEQIFAMFEARRGAQQDEVGTR